MVPSSLWVPNKDNTQSYLAFITLTIISKNNIQYSVQILTCSESAG